MESRLMASRNWGRRKWGMTAPGYGVSIWSDENVPELDSGDGFTTL